MPGIDRYTVAQPVCLPVEQKLPHVPVLGELGFGQRVVILTAGVQRPRDRPAHEMHIGKTFPGTVDQTVLADTRRAYDGNQASVFRTFRHVIHPR